MGWEPAGNGEGKAPHLQLLPPSLKNPGAVPSLPAHPELEHIHDVPADRFGSDRLAELEKGHLGPGMLVGESNSHVQEHMEQRGVCSSGSLSAARIPREAGRDILAMGMNKRMFFYRS